jgi:hypothetical protein
MRDTAYTRDAVRTRVSSPSGPPLIRWGAVFGGAVLGLALLALLTTLWLALAYGSGLDDIRVNLEWYLGGSAVLALFVSGILAGYFSGVRGAGTGMLHGFTIWGTLLIVTLSIGIPSVLNVFNLGRVATQVETGTGVLSQGADTALWASFWTLVVGFVAAGFGGAIGGLMTRGDRYARSDVRELDVRDRRDEPIVTHDDDAHDRDEMHDRRVTTSS